MTRHFETEAWVDYVRGLVAAEQAAEMRAHVESGCKACGNLLRLWQSVAEVAGKEDSYQPDEAPVRFVKGAYQIGHSRSKASGALQVAGLVFDSLLQPVPAGLRASAVSERQLLYKAGTMQVDLRIEPQAETKTVFLAGQILDAARPSKAGGEIPVSLLQGEDKVAHSTADAHGQFHLEFAARSEALSLQIEAGPVLLLLPLPAIGAGSTTAAEKPPPKSRTP